MAHTQVGHLALTLASPCALTVLEVSRYHNSIVYFHFSILFSSFFRVEQVFSVTSCCISSLLHVFFLLFLHKVFNRQYMNFQQLLFFFGFPEGKVAIS